MGGGQNCYISYYSYIILFVYYIVCGGRVAGIGMMEEAKSAVCVLARRGRRLGGTIMMARCSILNKHFSNVSNPFPLHPCHQPKNEKNSQVKTLFSFRLIRVRRLSKTGVFDTIFQSMFSFGLYRRTSKTFLWSAKDNLYYHCLCINRPLSNCPIIVTVWKGVIMRWLDRRQGSWY